MHPTFLTNRKSPQPSGPTVVFGPMLLAAALAFGPVAAFAAPPSAPSTAPAPQTAPAPSASSSTDSVPSASTSAMPTANGSSTAPLPNVPSQAGIKAGSIDDVSAVGNRDIGARGMGNWYSTESEIKMGKGYANEIEKSTKFINDPVVTEYVNRIGQNLVKNSDAKVPFTIKVIDSDEINAMALPGGFFYVNSGLILAADNEAELAGVMAHEIAHVAARHTTRQLTRYQFINYASLPLIFVGGGIGLAAREAAGIGIPMTFLKFSRGFEAEADYLGIQYMYKAGYDPNEFVNFFEKIQAQEKKKPGSMAKVFTDHPQTPDRITKSQEEIATILPAKDQYIETTSEFNDMKSRLASIENRHKVDDSNNPNKPSLRRSQASSKDGDKKDDDRPTLKRRDQ